MKTESKTKSNHSLKERNFSWKYFFDFNGEKSQVCKQFLINLYQITERRIKTIQNKLLSQTVLIDKRFSAES